MREDMRSEQNRKLWWLLISRFALFIVIFGAILITKPQGPLVYCLLLIYGAATASYLIAIRLGKRKSRFVSFKFLCSIPLVFELLIELLLIHITGGAQSPYLLLILLSVITAAFIYNLSGTLIFAAISAASYGTMVFLQFKSVIEFDILTPEVAIVYSDPETLFFSVYLFVCFLFIVAFLAGYLVKKLQLQIEQIHNLDKEISRLKLSTSEILAHLSNGVIVIDTTGEISHFNRTAQQILDIDYVKTSKKSIRTIFDNKLPEVSDMVHAFLAHANMKSLKKEITLLNGNNQQTVLKISISCLYELTGLSYGAVIIIEDISNEIRRNKLLQQMEKLAAIGDISARFAHEIRNPLASIRGSVEMLMGNISLPPEDKRLFELVIRESDRLTTLLESFLTFARIKEMPDEQFLMGKIDIGKMLEDMLLLWKQHSEYDINIKINSEIEPGDLIVNGREEQLAQAFSNIVYNSLQAMDKEDGEISIRVFDEKVFTDTKMVGIVIEDNGCGIEEKDIEYVFTPFYSNKKMGSGLGMAIANSIVTKHSGYIEVESEIKKGTRIIIYLNKADP